MILLAACACVFLIVGAVRTKTGPDGKLKVSRCLYAGAFCMAIAIAIAIVLLIS